MARKVTLFTGQWADLPLETLAKKAAKWGYDGLELACWGDHVDVARAAKDEAYASKIYYWNTPQAECLDGRTDVWAIGAILYQLLTGKRPFCGDRWDEIKEDVLTREPKPPEKTSFITLRA